MRKYIRINGKDKWFWLESDKQTAVFGPCGNILGSAIHRMNKSRYKIYIIWTCGATENDFPRHRRSHGLVTKTIRLRGAVNRNSIARRNLDFPRRCGKRQRQKNMKIFKKVLRILLVLLIAAIIGYFVFTGCEV